MAPQFYFNAKVCNSLVEFLDQIRETVAWSGRRARSGAKPTIWKDHWLHQKPIRGEVRLNFPDRGFLKMSEAGKRRCQLVIERSPPGNSEEPIPTTTSCPSCRRARTKNHPEKVQGAKGVWGALTLNRGNEKCAKIPRCVTRDRTKWFSFGVDYHQV